LILIQNELYIVGGLKLNQNKNDLSTFKESNAIIKYNSSQEKWIEWSNSFKQNNSLIILTSNLIALLAF
jgi:hypothetical protein